MKTPVLYATSMTPGKIWRDMITDEDINFGSMVTSPSSFNLDFEHDKELPAINCVDLFPNPPKLIESDSIQEDTSQGQPAQVDGCSDLNTESIEEIFKPIENEPALFNELIENNSSEILAKIEKDLEIKKEDEKSENAETLETSVPELEILDKIETITSSPSTAVCTKIQSPTTVSAAITNVSVIDDKTDLVTEEKNLIKSATSLPVASPSLSLSSYYSSAESVSSTSSSKKKKKKRYCQTCDLHFRRTHELLHHLKVHVALPSVQVVPLTEDNVHLQEYRERQRRLPGLEEYERELQRQIEKAEAEAGSLKLKLKLSGATNFQVVPFESLSPYNSKTTKKTTRILTAQEIKSSPPQSPACGGPIDAMVALSEMHLKQADQNLMDNKYFECPTLDGLDQFADEVNNEAAEELLKKLLEGNSQQIPQENDWSSNTNEFISIDRLAYMCTICNSNFPDAVRLYEHKRITGHDFQHPMQPPPPPQPHHMGMPNQFARPRMNYQPPHPHMVGGPGYQPPGGPQMNAMNMRPNFAPYPQRFPVMGPSFGQPQGVARRPPPLYRVPNSQNTHPVNMTPFADMNPEMYIPSSNGGMMMPNANGNMMMNAPNFPANQQQHTGPMVRQPVFLKARLQRAVRPRTPNMQSHSPNSTPSPPVVMSQPLVTRPRFLGPPFTGPPAKKIKRELGEDENIISTPPRTDGLPVIQSVTGGATTADLEKPKDPIQLNDQITLSLKNKETNKNPKEVANILANRGIIVTHKPKPMPIVENTAKTIAQEAVQKLQMNNSVSIISKKKPFEVPDDPPAPAPRVSGESAFISCPAVGCEEKFLTQEGLNRHTQRGHKMGKVNLKAYRCKVCPALFSTLEGVQDHKRKQHPFKTTADELGIPIVDLRNEQTKQKLASLGILNYIPLNAKTTNACFGFPIVSVQGAANPNVCNIMGMGVNSLLSLGPIKKIPIRRSDV